MKSRISESNRSRRLLLLAAIATVAALAIVATRGGSSSQPLPAIDGTQVANVPATAEPPTPRPTQSDRVRGPDGKPRPNATQLAELTQLVGYYGDNTPEPPFVGELDGFTFGPSSPEPGACTSGVGPDSPEFVPNDQAQAAFEASDLYFETAYVPGNYYPMPTSDVVGSHGLRASALSVTKCHGVVTDVLRTWVSSSGDPLQITRRSDSSPNLAPRLARDELETTTINGHPAIIIKPRFPGDQIVPAVVMRDDVSTWSISCQPPPGHFEADREVGIDELLKIAEGIQ